MSVRWRLRCRRLTRSGACACRVRERVCGVGAAGPAGGERPAGSVRLPVGAPRAPHGRLHSAAPGVCPQAGPAGGLQIPRNLQPTLPRRLHPMPSFPLILPASPLVQSSSASAANVLATASQPCMQSQAVSHQRLHLMCDGWGCRRAGGLQRRHGVRRRRAHARGGRAAPPGARRGAVSSHLKLCSHGLILHADHACENRLSQHGNTSHMHEASNKQRMLCSLDYGANIEHAAKCTLRKACP